MVLVIAVCDAANKSNKKKKQKQNGSNCTLSDLRQ